MPVNLGWCDGYYSKTYAERSCKVKFTAGNSSKEVTIRQCPDTLSTQGNHPYYQWGCKDPFLPASEDYRNKTFYDKDGSKHTDEDVKTGTLFSHEPTIKVGILNPDVMQSREDNYGSCEQYSNLWSASNDVHAATDKPVVKTIYDPSPVGFKLPAGDAFTGFTTSGLRETTISNINGTWDDSLKGWNFYTDPSKTKTIFFPALGYRDNSVGRMLGVSLFGDYWAAVPRNHYYGSSLNFRSSSVYPLYDANRGYVYAVRPSQE